MADLKLKIPDGPDCWNREEGECCNWLDFCGGNGYCHIFKEMVGEEFNKVDKCRSKLCKKPISSDTEA